MLTPLLVLGESTSEANLLGPSVGASNRIRPYVQMHHNRVVDVAACTSVASPGEAIVWGRVTQALLVLVPSGGVVEPVRHCRLPWRSDRLAAAAAALSAPRAHERASQTPASGRCGLSHLPEQKCDSTPMRLLDCPWKRASAVPTELRPKRIVVPAVLGDASGLPKLIDPFVAAGFARQDIDGIVCGNWRRAFGAWWSDNAGPERVRCT